MEKSAREPPRTCLSILQVPVAKTVLMFCSRVTVEKKTETEVPQQRGKTLEEKMQCLPCPTQVFLGRWLCLVSTGINLGMQREDKINTLKAYQKISDYGERHTKIGTVDTIEFPSATLNL